MKTKLLALTVVVAGCGLAAGYGAYDIGQERVDTQREAEAVQIEPVQRPIAMMRPGERPIALKVNVNIGPLVAGLVPPGTRVDVFTYLRIHLPA